MQTDEVLFIRVDDSANDGRARLSFHTSFDNPLVGAPPRESIEVRTLYLRRLLNKRSLDGVAPNAFGQGGDLSSQFNLTQFLA